MRTVKHPNLSEKKDRHATALALTNLRSKLDKQRFNIAPLEISAHRTGKDSLKSFLVSLPHGAMVPHLGTM